MLLDSLVYLVCNSADFSFFSFSPMLSVLLFTYFLEANDHVLPRSQVTTLIWKMATKNTPRIPFVVLISLVNSYVVNGQSRFTLTLLCSR